MSLRIGRVGVDVELNNPSSWSQNGNQVSLDGWMRAVSLEEAKALRQQLLGYVDSPSWEPEVPVVFDYDTSQNGWYRVLDVQVQDVLGVSQRNNMYQFSVTLERVGKYSAARAESRLYGALRSNAHVITSNSASAWHAVPAAATGYAVYGGGLSGVSNRSGVGGDIAVYQSNGLWNATATYRLAPENWYDAAARFADAGSYVGEQTGDLDEWVLKNDRCQLVYTGDWWLETVNSGAYAGSLGVTPGYRSGSNFTELSVTAVTPLRNSPVETSVRVELADPAATSTQAPNAVTLDLSLRRGAQFLEAVYSTVGEDRQFGVKFDLAVTSRTAGTLGTIYGAVTNTAVTGPNYGYLLSPQICQVSGTGGIMFLSTAASTAEFAVGWCVSSTTTVINTAVGEYFGPVYESLRVVSP